MFFSYLDKFIEVVDIILLNKLLDNGIYLVIRDFYTGNPLLIRQLKGLDKLKVSTTLSLWINLSSFRF